MMDSYKQTDQELIILLNTVSKYQLLTRSPNVLTVLLKCINLLIWQDNTNKQLRGATRNFAFYHSIIHFKHSYCSWRSVFCLNLLLSCQHFVLPSYVGFKNHAGKISIPNQRNVDKTDGWGHYCWCSYSRCKSKCNHANSFMFKQVLTWITEL